MLPIYVPSPELTARQIEVAQKLFELRSEKHDKLTRVSEIDTATPALESEWKAIQEELTYGLFGMVVKYEPAPPKPPAPPEPEVDPELVIPEPPAETPADGAAEAPVEETPPAA